MTPTREQVIEWAEEATILSDDAACQIQELRALAALAYSAGRAQGLREAREVCEANKADWIENAKCCTYGMYDFMADAADSCAAAIKQLEGK